MRKKIVCGPCPRSPGCDGEGFVRFKKSRGSSDILQRAGDNHRDPGGRNGVPWRGLLLSALLLGLALCLSLPALAAENTARMRTVDGLTVTVAEPEASLMAEQDPSLPQLSAPWRLEWGREYNNVNGGGYSPTYTELPGCINWTLGRLSQNRFRISYYRVGAETDEIIDSVVWYLSEYMLKSGHNHSDFTFLKSDFGTGDYYFTVTALGDGKAYRDSETVRSETWHYTDPGMYLPTPERPVWWDHVNAGGQWGVDFPSSEGELFYSAEVQFLYAKNFWEEPVLCGGSSGRWLVENGAALFDTDLRNGPGYYYACVRYCSRDITIKKTSGWSSLSDPIYITDKYAPLDNILSRLGKEPTPEEIQKALEAVRALDSGKLASAMLADRGNNVAAARIRELEALAGITTDVDVAEELDGAFDPAAVDVIGAGLNVDPGESVSLELGQADPGTVVPTMYHNAVQFSMHLENEAGEDLTPGGGPLASPVKITLPVPEGINPAFLVILHHHADGSYEELSVVSDIILSQDPASGQWSATFMVHSFSDFAIAEKIEATRQAEGVSMTLKLNPGKASTAVCAVYDGAGRLLAVRPLTLSGGEDTVLLPCDAGKAARVRVLLVDDQFRPAEAPWEQEL